MSNESSLKRVLLTGCAGFIGSHVLEALLRSGQYQIIGVDNLWTGTQQNLDLAFTSVGVQNAIDRFDYREEHLDEFTEYAGLDAVIHLAALDSVSRSIDSPRTVHGANVNAFFDCLNRARKAGVKRFIYASSSAVLHLDNPYAVTKRINELYAECFNRAYKTMECIGLRYFNVYGPRQNPYGKHAPLVAKVIRAMKENSPITIYGDGSATRDFIHVTDAARATLSMLSSKRAPPGYDYDVCTGRSETVQQVINYALEHFPDYDAPIHKVERRLFERQHSEGDPAMLGFLSDFKAHIQLKQGISETVKQWVPYVIKGGSHPAFLKE